MAVAPLSGSAHQVTKVFWFFFSKKNILPSALAFAVPFRHIPGVTAARPGARR
jgi:hypothetical protein